MMMTSKYVFLALIYTQLPFQQFYLHLEFDSFKSKTIIQQYCMKETMSSRLVFFETSNYIPDSSLSHKSNLLVYPLNCILNQSDQFLPSHMVILVQAITISCLNKQNSFHSPLSSLWRGPPSSI